VFLRFLYTGEVDKLDEMYLELFTAADKYDVRPLREICIQHMATNISVDNAVEVLALAERHSIGTVKSSALKFIKTNFVDVVKTDSWSSLLVNQLGATKRMSDGGCQSGEITPTNKK
jgi:speckle-type POZ protein